MNTKPGGGLTLLHVSEAAQTSLGVKSQASEGRVQALQAYSKGRENDWKNETHAKF